MLEVDANNNNTNHAYPNDYLLSWNFLDVPSEMIAEQLTVVDAVSCDVMRRLFNLLSCRLVLGIIQKSSPSRMFDQDIE